MQLLYSWCLFLDDGKVLKVVSIPKENWETEEIILEELSVFQVIQFFVIRSSLLILLLLLQCFFFAICWPATWSSAADSVWSVSLRELSFPTRNNFFNKEKQTCIFPRVLRPADQTLAMGEKSAQVGRNNKWLEEIIFVYLANEKRRQFIQGCSELGTCWFPPGTNRET